MDVLPILFVIFAFVHGAWSGSDCKLESHPSVFYGCPGSDNAPRPCSSQEPEGTIVKPECNAPFYYSPNPLPLMKCSNGNWNNIVTCKPECGLIPSDGNRELRASDKKPATKGKLPWHAIIYMKTTTPYRQICGGSLISPTVVISAAHCFWSNEKKKLPASDYAVAVGKQYRQWNDERDTDAQKSDVQAVRLPSRFFGSSTNYQEDIAVVVVATAFKFNYHVLPVCLDFDVSFERRQLRDGSIGKMVSWDSISNGAESAALQVLDLSYIDVGQCLATSPTYFIEYITADKICAGYAYNDLLLGNGGSGLVFPEATRGSDRYYLRGVASTAPNRGDHVEQMIVAFTQVLKHEHFISMD